MARVAVFGIGYVGSVAAACLGRDGHTVVGVDVDDHKVAALNQGQAPVTEPGLDALATAQVRAGRLRATTCAGEAVAATDVALVCVGTPSGEDGGVDASVVEAVVAEIGRALRGTERSYVVAIRSTLLPGILEERLAPALAEMAERRLGDRLWLGNNPEFLREGSAIADYDAPPFTVVGADAPEAARRLLDLYANVDAERIVTDTRTAAMVKYACNAFHGLKVAFANEVGALSRALGADGAGVMDIVCRDRKLNVSAAYLRPGFAFGGSCLPKDLRAIVRTAERDAIKVPVLSAVLPSNEHHLQRAVRRVEQAGVREVGLAGLSFKAGTDDLRESPQVRLAEILIGRGYDLRIYDPDVNVSRLRGRNLAYVDRHLPHLARLMVEDVEALTAHAHLLIVGRTVAGLALDPWAGSGRLLDLRRDLTSAPG